MMQQLIDEVSQKTGLSPDQSKAAVDSVLGFLKTKLPAPLASHLDSLVSGGATAAAATGGESSGGGLASQATAMLGSLFHKDTKA